jgi:hypothetical protein
MLTIQRRHLRPFRRLLLLLGLAVHVPSSINRRLVGRGNIVHRLKAQLLYTSDCADVALIGQGGIGEPPLVLQPAHRTRQWQPDSLGFLGASAAVGRAYRNISLLRRVPGRRRCWTMALHSWQH